MLLMGRYTWEVWVKRVPRKVGRRVPDSSRCSVATWEVWVTRGKTMAGRLAPCRCHLPLLLTAAGSHSYAGARDVAYMAAEPAQAFRRVEE